MTGTVFALVIILVCMFERYNMRNMLARFLYYIRTMGSCL